MRQNIVSFALKLLKNGEKYLAAFWAVSERFRLDSEIRFLRALKARIEQIKTMDWQKSYLNLVDD